tara:strand:- start:1701 stop:2537 length:837 start_codon:yes stop_codon:yes gene_type:complete
MVNLINYNFMTKPAIHCIDESDEFYRSCGVSRGNKNGFDINNLKDGDIIFVKTDYIHSGLFQKQVLPLIKTKFILITGVSSFSVDEGDSSYLSILDNTNLIKWFCTNPPSDYNEKILWLPIGFEEPEREGGDVEILNNFYNNQIPWGDKENKIYIPYHSNTFKDRNTIISNLSKEDFVVVEPNRLSFNDYLSKMSEYKYVLSLRGAGWDCHRHYESILVGSVPIMEDGPILKSFKNKNLPVIDILDINSKIFNYSFDFLYSRDFLTMDYHFNKIKNIK